MIVVRRWLLATCLLLAAAPVRADSPTVDPDVEAARGHFRRGRRFFEGERYEDALREFESAYQVKALPEFQFNVALCDERLGRLEAAVAAYRRFIEGSRNAEDVAEARRRVAELEEQIRARPAPPPPTPTPAPAPPPTVVDVSPPPRRSLAAPIAVGAAAVAVAVVGTALVGSVAADYGPLHDQWLAQPTPALQQRAHELALRADVGYALWGVAAAVAVIDVVLWVVWRRPAPADRAMVLGELVRF